MTIVDTTAARLLFQDALQRLRTCPYAVLGTGDCIAVLSRGHVDMEEAMGYTMGTSVGQ